jgi:hypothetical protein
MNSVIGLGVSIRLFDLALLLENHNSTVSIDEADLSAVEAYDGCWFELADGEFGDVKFVVAISRCHSNIFYYLTSLRVLIARIAASVPMTLP